MLINMLDIAIKIADVLFKNNVDLWVVMMRNLFVG